MVDMRLLSSHLATAWFCWQTNHMHAVQQIHRGNSQTPCKPHGPKWSFGGLYTEEKRTPKSGVVAVFGGGWFLPGQPSHTIALAHPDCIMGMRTSCALE